MNPVKTYRINKIFPTIQGEGKRTGEPMTFIRFSGCNLRCPFCDTDHKDGREYTIGEILKELAKYDAMSLSLCGGEPSLQVDKRLIDALKETGYRIGIETNGTNPLPDGIDYLVVSPKTKNIHPYFNTHPPDELRYPIKHGDPVPMPHVKAKLVTLTPIFDGEKPVWANIKYAIGICQRFPSLYHLNIQAHKFIGVE